MNALLLLLSTIVNLYLWAVLAYIILSWLISFNVVSIHTPAVAAVSGGLRRLVEPALGLIRRSLDRIGVGTPGGIDLAPLVLLLMLYFISNLIRLDIVPAIRS